MKKCPNWNSPEDSVSGKWKQDLLRYLGKQFNLDILIETGTCEGATCQALADDFKIIFTIELSDHYYLQSQRRLKNYRNVDLFKGDSRKILPEMLKALNGKKVLFWLDAHSSGGATAQTDPLAEELAIITEASPNSLIVIDDLKDAELRHVKEAGVSLDGWISQYVTGEIILYKDGNYIIPPFEEWSDN